MRGEVLSAEGRGSHSCVPVQVHGTPRDAGGVAGQRWRAQTHRHSRGEEHHHVSNQWKRASCS